MANKFGVTCCRALLASGFLLTCLSFSFGQGDTGSQAIGLPAHGSFSGSDFDNVQLNNGNLHIEIPLYSVGGRGLSVPVSLVYDSKGWYADRDNIPVELRSIAESAKKTAGEPSFDEFLEYERSDDDLWTS